MVHSQKLPFTLLFLLLSIWICFIRTRGVQVQQESKIQDIEIVVAHFDEDLSYFNDILGYTIIYTKSGKHPDNILPRANQSKAIISLPNIGRESHTYLHHIVHNYETLAAITLFIQGNPEPHIGGAISAPELLLAALRTTPREVKTFNRAQFQLWACWDGIPWSTNTGYVSWLAKQRAGDELQRAALTPAQFWRFVFDEPAPPLAVRMWRGAIFAVPPNVVRRRSREFYVRILEVFEGSERGRNPEIGLHMEAFWLAVFSDDHVLRRRVGGDGGLSHMSAGTLLEGI